MLLVQIDIRITIEYIYGYTIIRMLLAYTYLPNHRLDSACGQGHVLINASLIFRGPTFIVGLNLIVRLVCVITSN